jgi:hypothetical protein
VTGGAWKDEQHGGDEFGGDDGEGCGPDEARRDEVGEVRGEVGEGVELCAGREEKERRETKAADVDEQLEDRPPVQRCL